MNGDVDASGKLLLETPEQVGIELEVAGIGSRFLAALVDLLCMAASLVVASVIALGAAGGNSWGQIGRNASRSESWTKGLSATATILLLLAVFLVQWGYYIICEMLTRGASPGKRVMGLRVIRDDGRPIGFAQSVLRNLVRLVDFLPWGYGLGLIVVFASSRSQRLGDMAAGTLVTRLEPVAAPVFSPPAALPSAPPAPRANAELLGPADRALLQKFIDRRPQLLPAARAELARAIAAPLRQKLGAADPVPAAVTASIAGADADVGPDEAWLAALHGRITP